MPPVRDALRPALLLALGLLAWCGGTAQAMAAPGRPNIVFIVVDDLDAGTAQRMWRTQRRIGAEGARFYRAYAEFALCSPSRTTMLTGRYAHNTGVRHNDGPLGGFRAFLANGLALQTVNHWLQAAGYRTGLIGKLINGYPNGLDASGVLPGWDEWFVQRETTAEGFTVNENGTWVSRSTSEAYDTDLYTARARAFLRDSADRGQPFALFLWYRQLHTPVGVALRHAHLFAAELAPRSAAFLEVDQRDKPPFLRLATRDASWVARLDATHRDRLRSAQAIDEGIAAIYGDLQAAGLLASTYLVVTSDNGFELGEHRLGDTKGFAYEESVRVPLLVRGPGVPAGRTIGQLVGTADFAPTFAEWAGITPPVEVDGRSFAALLRAPSPASVPWRRALPLSIMRQPLTEWPAVWADGLNPQVKTGYDCIRAPSAWASMRGVRTQRYTLTHYATGDMELYDRQLDPHQLDNAICGADPALRQRLRDLAEALSTCRGQACRTLEDTRVP